MFISASTFTRSARLGWALIVLLAISLGPLPHAHAANAAATTIAVGQGPRTVAVNPATNKIYVANEVGGTVTVIDGSTNKTSTVSAGAQPSAAAVNPATNKIYVANTGSNNVTVIDGSNNSTTKIGVGSRPYALAVNAITNKIYVANIGSNTVTVIDGSNNKTTSVNVGATPLSLAVNIVTNKVYVGNYSDGTLTVIDGATNTPVTQAFITGRPSSVAVNPASNKVYLALQDVNSLGVIDTSAGKADSMPIGSSPQAVAVDPTISFLYVANQGSAEVVMFQEVAGQRLPNESHRVPVGSGPTALAVNSRTHQAAVASLSGSVTLIEASGRSATFPVGQSPTAISVNPVTNKIYVANTGSNSVSVIDGAINTINMQPSVNTPYAVATNPATGRTYVTNISNNSVTVLADVGLPITTIPVGTFPAHLVINPITNKIYVANSSSNNVTVIDGATNTTTTIAVGAAPASIVVNAVTNKIYVANINDNTLSVIDGNTNGKTTLSFPAYVSGLTVNPVTNRIYAAMFGATKVGVIDGTNNTVTFITVAGGAAGIAVNSATNKIYLANQGGSTVTVLDGATNATTSVNVGQQPLDIKVNPITNKIYVSNELSNTVTVIDGATNATTTLPAGSAPFDIVINPATNMIYVTIMNDNVVLAIDGATNQTSKIATGMQPLALDLNPISGTVYIGNATENNVTIIRPNSLPNIIPVSVVPLAGNRTPNATQTFTIQQSSASAISVLPVRQVYFQFDTWTGPWKRASKSGANWTAQPSTLPDGIHILYAYAGDGQDATSDNTGPNNSPLISQIIGYVFVKGEEAGDEAPIIFAPTDLPAAGVGVAYTQQITASGAGPYRYAAVEGQLPAGLTFRADGRLSGTPSEAGRFDFTVTATAADGNVASQGYTLVVAPAAAAVDHGAVQPVLECVSGASAQALARFGYRSANTNPVTLTVGITNSFAPAPADRGQPIVFAPGRQRGVVEVPFDDANLTWALIGPDGSTRSASASGTALACQLPIKTVISGTQATLSWPADGAAGVTYNLLRATNASGPWTQINAGPLVPQGGQVLTHDTLDNSALFYVVERVTPDGESAWLDPALVTSGPSQAVYLALVQR